jgi:hypothetical protein
MIVSIVYKSIILGFFAMRSIRSPLSGPPPGLARLEGRSHGMKTANKQLLLVDDRIKYANLIADYFSGYGYMIDRAVSAKEGIERLNTKGIGHYRVVVTDITMEHQLAGLEVIYFLFKKKYTGTVVMASTGFDVFLGMFFSKLLMGLFGVHYLVPKAKITDQSFVFYPARLGSSPQNTFVEIGAI